jgi:hypothetical protein
MSDIENNHAKPAMSELIVGNSDVPIETLRARSIALFCFKTAAVIDLISPLDAPFFRKGGWSTFTRQGLRLKFGVPQPFDV